MEEGRETENNTEKHMLNYLDEVHSRLRGRGPYVYRSDAGLFLAQNMAHEPVEMITLVPTQRVWEVPGDTGSTYLLRFVLQQHDLTLQVGRRIIHYLETLQSKKIRYILVRPLPPEILSQDLERSIGPIPTGCESCLDLFRITKSGSTIFCDGSRLRGFSFTKYGRRQVYEYLKAQFGVTQVTLADGTQSTLPIIEVLSCIARSGPWTLRPGRFDFPTYWVSKVGWEPSQVLISMLKKYRSRLGRGPILDDGGAHGKDSFHLNAEALNPILVDLNADLLKIAARRCEELMQFFPIVHCDGSQLPFGDNIFRGVFSGGVMHHAMTKKKAQKYLNEASRVLCPGGLLFGNVLAQWEGERAAPPKTTLYENASDLTEMIEGANLRLIEPLNLHHTPFETHKKMWIFVCQKN